MIKRPSGKNLQIQFEQISEKRTQWKFSFQMRGILTLMVSIILRMIECGQSTVLTLTEKDGVKQRRKVMVWLGACSKSISPLVILNERTIDHAVYIKKVLPVALKYGNEVLGSDWIFEESGAKPHSHYLTKQWCRDNFFTFINSESWPPNSSDLNPLDYSNWDELINAINWDKVKLSFNQ